jgi:phosphate transport system permease protein
MIVVLGSSEPNTTSALVQLEPHMSFSTSQESIELLDNLLPSGAQQRRRAYERVVRMVLMATSFTTVIVLFAVAGSLIPPTIDFFQEVSFGEFFGTTEWYPLFEPPAYGIWALLSATFLVMSIAIFVAVPGGLAAAFFLNQYASDRVRRYLKPTLEILAGMPTVVFGFFAVNFVSPNLVQRFWPFGEVNFYNALSAGLVVGIMILPMMTTLAEDAMNAIPKALIEGAYALGPTKREVCTGVIFPSALSGIIASIVISLSRAIGETTIVLLAAGASAKFTLNPGESVQTLASFIGFAGIGDQETDSTGYRTIFAVGTFLFIITFVLNIISIRVVRRFREVYE